MNTLDKIKYLRNRVYNSNGQASVIEEDLKELDHYIHLFETGKGGLTDDEITHFNTLNHRYRDSSGMSSQYDFKNKHFAQNELNRMVNEH